MEFGPYIRGGRERLGERLGHPVTQEDVEALIGITKGGQYLSRWERGINLPKAGQVAALIRELDLDEAETWTLFGRAQARREPVNGAEDAAERAAGAAEADADMPASEDSEQAGPDTPAAEDGP